MASDQSGPEGLEARVLRAIEEAQEPVGVSDLVADFDVRARVLREVLLRSEGLVALSGDRWARPHVLIDGLVEAHRLRAAEIERDRLARTTDLPLIEVTGGGELETGGRLAPDKDAEGFGWLLPPDVLDGAEPGDLLVLHHSDATIRPELQRDPQLPSDLSQPAGRLRGIAEELRGDSQVLEVAQLATELADRAPEVLREPVPFGDLIEATDLVVCDGCILLADEDPEQWRLQRERRLVDPEDEYDPEVVESVSRLRVARDQMRRDGRLAAGDAGRLNESLSEPAAVELATVHLLGIEGDPDGSTGRLLEAIESSIDGHPAPGWHVLRARLAEFERDTDRQVTEIEAALDAADDFAPALGDHAWNFEDRGELAGAVGALRSAGIRTPDAQLQRLERLQQPPFEGTGRNEPCPCGSGRKYKHCHLRTEERSLDDRVDWLLAKALTFIDRPAQRATVLGHLGPFEEALEGGLGIAIRDPIVAGLLLFEHGMVATFAEVRGDLLPDDERELAFRWRDEVGLVPVRVDEHGDERVAVTVLTSGEELELTGTRETELLAEAEAGQAIATFVVPTPAGPRPALAAMLLPEPLLDDALEAMRAGDPGQLSAWYAGELARRVEAGPDA